MSCSLWKSKPFIPNKMRLYMSTAPSLIPVWGFYSRKDLIYTTVFNTFFNNY